MDQDKITNTETIILSWIKSSDDNFDTMLDLYGVKRYNWALFLGHLCLEKLLKAYFVKVNKMHAPLLHNLSRIAELSELQLSKEQKNNFATITTFNINARYDDYKQSFDQKCTKEFADVWIIIIKQYRQWIKELL